MSDEVWSADDRIQAIFDTAEDYARPWAGETKKAALKCFSDAIDAAMSHAFAEGYAECQSVWRQKELTDAAERAKSLPAQIERIWGLPSKAA